MDKKVAFNFKLYYFFRFMGQGFFYPFLVLYLNHKGINFYSLLIPGLLFFNT
jgi:hypothetical protein